MNGLQIGLFNLLFFMMKIKIIWTDAEYENNDRQTKMKKKKKNRLVGNKSTIYRWSTHLWCPRRLSMNQPITELRS